MNSFAYSPPSPASFNEKLVVNNGQVVSPQPLKGTAAAPSPSINQLIYQINNDRDFDDFVLKHASKVPSVRSELQYVKHPTQAPTQTQPNPVATSSADRRASLLMQNQTPSSFPAPQPESTSSPANFQPVSQPSESMPQTRYQNQPTGYYQSSPSQQPPHNASAYSPVAPNPYAQPDHPQAPVGQASAHQTSGVLHGSGNPPVNPVFGVTLDQLFARDGSPVPLVVYQCIQAVDLYGLEVEGIYRIPGTSTHIQAMKALFDNGMFWSSKQDGGVDTLQTLPRLTSVILKLFNTTSIVLPVC